MFVSKNNFLAHAVHGYLFPTSSLESVWAGGVCSVEEGLQPLQAVSLQAAKLGIHFFQENHTQPDSSSPTLNY